MGNKGSRSPGEKTVRKAKLSMGERYPFVPEEHMIIDIWKEYKEKKLLGKGASCSVYQVSKNDTKDESAMKVLLQKDQWNPILFKQEFEILHALDHEGILGYRDVWIDSKNFYIFTELLTGGELFDAIKKKNHFPENEGADVMRQLFSAIEHMHSKNIVHRDLKPENIVYGTPANERLVVIDLGDAKLVDDEELYDDFVGTAFYLAPECVRDRRGWELKASDCWTCGVIAYVVMTGRPPFWGRDNKEILRRILKAKLKFPSSIPLSEGCVHFIRKLVRKTSKHRYTAQEALNDKWLGGGGSDVEIVAGGHHHHHKKHHKKHKKHGDPSTTSNDNYGSE